MGFSLGEIFLLILVGIIVVGPKRLPGLMRTAGQYVARLRRMSTDLRSQSGIDDLLRQEGLDQHIHELRSLSRLNVVDTLIAPAVSPVPRPSIPQDTGRDAGLGGTLDQPAARFDRPRPRPWVADEPLREREYPLAGCDAYGALPDDAATYAPGPPDLAADVALYAPAPLEPAPTEADLAGLPEPVPHEGEHPQPAEGHT